VCGCPASNIGKFVSVIIPVYNDVEPLKICLEALENQTYPKNLYEVIVVDNGSDATQDIKGLVSHFDQVEAFYESFPSSYAARNKGLQKAKGQIIAFTDADCIPDPNWIQNGVRNLLQVPNCGLVAGKIDIFFRDSHRPTAIELYESITALRQEHHLKNNHFGVTANIFTFKEVIENVGDFNKNLKSGGDFEWGLRVFAYGYYQLYAEDASVRHPARFSLGELYKRTIRIAGGVYDRQNLKLKNYSPIKQNLFFFQDLIQSFRPPLRFMFNTFLDPRLPNLEKKFKVAAIILFVRYISIWEKIRLKAGASSARK